MRKSSLKIKKIAEKSEGIVTTKQIEDSGINRTSIKSCLEEGILVRESHGVYSLADNIIDDYKLIQMRSKKLVFSYGTALYLHGMSDRVPHIIDITVPQGYNVTRIKKDYPSIRFHYVKKDIWELGISDIISPMGAQLTLYDKERCICDLIKNRQEVDMQLYTQAVKEYFEHNSNIRKLLKYGKILRIEDKIRTYIEVLTYENFDC